MRRVLAVAVEVVGVRIEAGECDFDRPDARFDEPAGQQAAAAETRFAVRLADASRLAIELEGLELIGRHHLQGMLDRVLVQRLFDLQPPAALERLRDDGQVRDAAILPVRRNGRLQVGNLAARVVHAKGVELVAQKSAPRRPFRVPDRDVLRQDDGRRWATGSPGSRRARDDAASDRGDNRSLRGRNPVRDPPPSRRANG